MKTRIEKNRKHFATLIAAVLGTTMMLFMNQVAATPPFVFKITILVALVVLVMRSLVIEAGIRRSANGLEKKLDGAFSEFAEKRLGIMSLPNDSMDDVPSRREKNDAEPAASDRDNAPV